MAEIPYQNINWVMFAMGLVATLVFSLATNKRELKAGEVNIDGQIIKAILSTIAFVIWAFILGAPFKDALS